MKVLAFTSRASGITIELESPVGICAPNGQAPENLEFKGIWDTGATGCAITKRVADLIGVVPTCLTHVGGVHGIELVEEYTIDLYLPNKTLIKEVDATTLSDDAACDFLIGMDIISLGDFAVSNFQGKTFFTFRVPSIAHADYTTQNPTHCPCGSGKKYKKCCGA